MRSALAPFRTICALAGLFGLGAIHPRKSTIGSIDDSISGSAAFRNVTRGMVAAGFSDNDIANILGLSLLRLFERVRACAGPVPAEYAPRFPQIGDATDGVTPW